MLARQGVPPRRCRKQPVHGHKRLDRRCRKIETLFSRLKNWRRLANRYDVCAPVFCSATLLTLGKVIKAAEQRHDRAFMRGLLLV